MPESNDKVIRSIFKKGNKILWPYLITVDPGLTGTRFALWRSFETNCQNIKKMFLISSGILNDKSSADWLKRSCNLATMLRNIIDIHFPKRAEFTLVCESTHLWESSNKSQTSVRGGDLFKLTTLIGMFVNEAHRLGASDVLLIHENTWKGSLPKPIVEKRINKLLGKIILSHAADAVGIGLSLAGLLSSDKRGEK